MFFLIVCTIFVLSLNTALSCWSGGSYYKWHRPTATQFPHAAEFGQAERLNVSGIKDHLERHLVVAWEGWTPPPAVEAAWKLWRDTFKNRTNQDFFNKHNKERLQKERGHGSGWPHIPGWKDLGEGSDGVPVPPWAYVPKYSGKHSICLLAPRKGDCKGKNTKWGYNPYTDQCESYIWSGCGGTRNRFDSKQQCEQRCTIDPPPSCADDSGIPKDYTITYDQ